MSTLLLVAGFSVNKYGISASNFDGAKDITDVVNNYPVDLIEFKLVLEEYIHHVCENNDEYLEALRSDVDSCINQYEKTKQMCSSKVFRLAPLKIESKVELQQYGQDYKACTLPYKNIVG